MTPLDIAISPCPNDTYIFQAWIQGDVGKEVPPNPHFADIEQLNLWALQGQFPLIKISIPTYSKIVKNYQLLDVGAAVGWHVGPKIIAKKKYTLKDLPQLKMALPGQETTAHFLVNHLVPQPKEKIFCLYHEIGKLLNNGDADCGVIIHESRFTFIEEGFLEIVDLGSLWHEKTNLPLPLGGIALHRDYSPLVFEDILRQSLQAATLSPFIFEHAQIKEKKVIEEHIALYVNKEAYSLSKEAKQAIEKITSFCNGA